MSRPGNVWMFEDGEFLGFGSVKMMCMNEYFVWPKLVLEIEDLDPLHMARWPLAKDW